MKKGSKILQILKIGFVWSVLVFIGLELFLRIFNPLPFRVSKGEILLPANQQLIMENRWIDKLEKKIYYSRNKMGMRGEDIQFNIDSQLSVITVGGSTTECKFLSDSLTWTEKFKKYSEPEIPVLKVNNAGLDGTSTFAHLLLLRDYLVSVKPDYILFLIGTNDTETSAPSEFDFLHSKLEGSASIKSKIKSLFHRSEVVSACFNFYRIHLAYKKGLIHKGIDYRNRPLIPNSPEFVSKRLRDQSDYLASYKNRVLGLDSICKQNLINPVFITQPSLCGSFIDPTTGINFSTISTDDEQTNSGTWWKILETYNEILRELEKEGQIKIIDLARQMPKDSRYYYDFTHYTPSGADMVGKIVAKNFLTIHKETN